MCRFAIGAVGALDLQEASGQLLVWAGVLEAEPADATAAVARARRSALAGALADAAFARGGRRLLNAAMFAAMAHAAAQGRGPLVGCVAQTPATASAPRRP